MGIDINIHIGPYMVTKSNKEIQKECTVNTCLNTDCETHKENQVVHSKFCANCGYSIGKKKYIEIEKITPYSLLEDEFLDELHCAYDYENIEIYISNQCSPFDREFDSDRFFEIDLQKADSQKEIDWFKERFKKIISCFELEFGKDSIEFKWGIIKWFS